jgi:hypothetical protein
VAITCGWPDTSLEESLRLMDVTLILSPNQLRETGMGLDAIPISLLIRLGRLEDWTLLSRIAWRNCLRFITSILHYMEKEMNRDSLVNMRLRPLINSLINKEAEVPALEFLSILQLRDVDTLKIEDLLAILMLT